MMNIEPLNRSVTGFHNSRRSSQWRRAILVAAGAHCAMAVLGQAPGTPTAKPLAGSGSTNQMSEVIVTGDYTEVIPTEPIQSVVGFGKTLVETPRSVTVVSAELLNAAGIENVEDLYRIAPSTYTNFRFGLGPAGQLPHDLHGLRQHRHRARTGLTDLRRRPDRRLPELQPQDRAQHHGQVPGEV
ncbi:MAG: hypothetical protein NTX70_11950 [Verrucomicrobia bacterium]|nr:hypothetical protein [Verrucomicrobiota bacterium]